MKLDNYQRRDACEICGKSKEMSPLVVLPIYTLLPTAQRAPQSERPPCADRLELRSVRTSDRSVLRSDALCYERSDALVF